MSRAFSSLKFDRLNSSCSRSRDQLSEMRAHADWQSCRRRGRDCPMGRTVTQPFVFVPVSCTLVPVCGTLVSTCAAWFCVYTSLVDDCSASVPLHACVALHDLGHPTSRAFARNAVASRACLPLAPPTEYGLRQGYLERCDPPSPSRAKLGRAFKCDNSRSRR